MSAILVLRKIAKLNLNREVLAQILCLLVYFYNLFVLSLPCMLIILEATVLYYRDAKCHRCELPLGAEWLSVSE